VLIVRATKKLLSRIGPGNPHDEDSTRLLDPWYTTAQPVRPQTSCMTLRRGVGNVVAGIRWLVKESFPAA
jgi:hypothetical protein